MNMIPAHSPTQTLFPPTSVLHAHTHTYAGSKLSSCPWAYGFSEGLSAPVYRDQLHQAHQICLHMLPGFELSRTSTKNRAPPYITASLESYATQGELDPEVTTFWWRIMHSVWCLLSDWFVFETAEEAAGKLKFTLRWTLDKFVYLH